MSTAWHPRCAALLLGAVLAGSAAAGCLDEKQQRGVNLSGAEFGHKKLPGVLFKDYAYPAREDLVYFRAQGMNLIRLPFRWERVQRQPRSALDAAELVQLHRVVDWARELGLCVVLDLHNFGAYYGQALEAGAFTDVWLRLASEFSDPGTVALGLMNEPSALKGSAWVPVAQATVLALREAGARHWLLVPSGRWSGAHEWRTAFDGTSAADSFAAFRDPLERYSIELHQYADANFSGTETGCLSPARMEGILNIVSTWAREHKRQLFLGEFGVPATAPCTAALASMLSAMQDHTVWRGWAYWSAGRWWGNYPLSIQPGKNPPAPQLQLLRDTLIATP